MVSSTSKCLAIIPARMGSKGIIGKNRRKIAGQTLVDWAIQAASNAESIRDIALSTDDPHFLELYKHTAIKLVERPAHLTGDLVGSAEVVWSVLKNLQMGGGDNYEWVCLLQPTSPFRSASHIDKAFSQMLSSGGDACISVSEADNTSLKGFIVDDSGSLRGAVNDDLPFKPRQELPKYYRANGAIYLVHALDFMLRASFMGTKTVPFLMDAEESLDIDSLTDLRRARELAPKYLKKIN